MTRLRHAARLLGLRARVTAVFAALALVLSVGLAVASYALTRSYLVGRRVETARQEAFLNARAVRDALRADPANVQGALEEAGASGDNAVVLRVGEAWFGTSVGVGRDDLPGSLEEVVAEGSAGTQRTEVADAPTIAVGVPLPAIGGAYFELVDLGELDQTLTTLAQALAVAAVLITIVGAILGWYASGRVLRPLRRMASAASGIREGGLDQRLDAEGDSDLEPLVDAFNDMVSALQERIEREARFASDVSHELRTPLAKMSAALNVARRRQSAASTEAALDVLDTELRGFTGLVVDLLDISRMEAGAAELELAAVRPQELVRDVLDSTQREQVRVHVAPSAPAVVMIDRRRIARALMNLLDNADAYAKGAVSVLVTGDQHVLRLCVDDHGPGVPVDEREYVFDRFARGRSSSDTHGTGLGLALVVEHVRLHGGRVWVEDAPGGGARFVVQVPKDGS